VPIASPQYIAEVAAGNRLGEILTIGKTAAIRAIDMAMEPRRQGPRT